MKTIPIVIPVYQPDEKLIELVEKLKDDNFVIIVNDGSEKEYSFIFDQVSKNLSAENGIVLSHGKNRGKGAALKTAFRFVLDNKSDCVGVVTADSDGQHTSKDINKIASALLNNRASLILGVREFEKEDIPWKSRFGNKFTKQIMKYICGATISDTQTGLRGIPIEFIKDLISVQGERFEFETNMLLEAIGKYKIVEIPIETIYDSKSNHKTHFNPIKDSIAIYKALGAVFFRYVLSSFASSIIDLLVFSILCAVFKKFKLYIMLSTIIARIISATSNFMINYKVVFKSNANKFVAIGKYVGLAITIMLSSGVLVTLGHSVLNNVSEIAVKIVVDACLFLVSYKVQQAYVFKYGARKG